MPFPPELINQNETLVLDLRPHWWYFTPSAALLGLALLVGAIVAASDWWDPIKLLTGIAVLVALGFFAARYAQWATTNFVVTSDRVIYRVGVFAKKGTEIPIEKINAVHFEQRIFERVLGLGNLRIESAADEGSSLFEDIRKPSAVQKVIYQQADLHNDRDYEKMGRAAGAASAAANTNAASAESIPEQIEKLSGLRDSGAITPEEYEAKKAELLDRM